MALSNFDSITLDALAEEKLYRAKNLLLDLAAQLDRSLPQSRERALVYTKLEEAFDWIKKAVRNDQIQRVNRLIEEQRQELEG